MSGGVGGGFKMEERSGVNRRPVVRVDSNLEERDRTCVNGEFLLHIKHVLFR